MMKKRPGHYLFLALILSVPGGCANKMPAVTTTTTPTLVPSTPKPTATSPLLAAQAVGANVTLFGKSGEKVAILHADSAGFDPTASQKSIVVSRATATLFDRDHPGSAVSELKADTVIGNRENRTLTATGNASIRSLTEKGTPMIRADQMVWSFDNRDVKGEGNVLVSAQPNLRIPGHAFTADTQLRTFRLQGDGRPATGGNIESLPR